MSEWISIKDRLPKSSGHVLAIINTVRHGRKVCIGWYDPLCGGWNGNGGSMKNITHWMPLPKLPKEVPE